MKKSLGVAVALLLILALGGGVEAQDAAAPWSIRFSHKPLDVITVPYKDGSATTFYYMLFTLKNQGRAMISTMPTAPNNTNRAGRISPTTSSVSDKTLTPQPVRNCGYSARNPATTRQNLLHGLFSIFSHNTWAACEIPIFCGVGN